MGKKRVREELPSSSDDNHGMEGDLAEDVVPTSHSYSAADLKKVSKSELDTVKRTLKHVKEKILKKSTLMDDELLSDDEVGDGEEPGEEERGKVLKKIPKSKLKKYQEKQDRKGVVYLSRVPPYMRPDKIRHIMSQFGAIGRVYLAPEDPTVYKKRKKMGGNKKQKYGEGWVEFEDKSIAKRVALSLNNTPLGGSKRNYYRDDIWNIKYLSGFKWNNLTEKIAYDIATRDTRIREEIAASKRENAFYLDKVEQGKTIEKIEERKKSENRQVNREVRRTFGQKAPLKDSEKKSVDKNLVAKVLKSR